LADIILGELPPPQDDQGVAAFVSTPMSGRPDPVDAATVTCFRVTVTIKSELLTHVQSDALVRLIDGILAALTLLLVAILSALSHQPDAIAFVLVVVATCRHYGHRGEPDGHSFLPMHPGQTSVGGRPHG
jgi:hypothetical protein